MYLSDIITSEVRVKLLVELFSEPNKNLYVRELTRRVGTEVNAIRRELKRLTTAGVVKKEQRGNRLYYLVRKDYPFYHELLSIVAKSSGFGKLVIENSNTFGKIKLAILSQEFFEGRESKSDQLDLLFVGDLDLNILEETMKDLIRRISRDVNYTVMTESDFQNQKSRKESFLISFLISPNVVLIGSPEKFLN